MILQIAQGSALLLAFGVAFYFGRRAAIRRTTIRRRLNAAAEYLRQ